MAGHSTAAWLLGLIDRRDSPIHVLMLDGSNPGSRDGARIHRPGKLLPNEVRWRQDIPLTSPADTVLDLAATVGRDELEAAWALAVSERLAGDDELRSAVEASPRRPGLAALRELAARWVRPAVRQRGRSLVARRPRGPRGRRVPHSRLSAIVRERPPPGCRLQGRGIEVLRFTGPRIREHPYEVVARLAGSWRWR